MMGTRKKGNESFWIHSPHVQPPDLQILSSKPFVLHTSWELREWEETEGESGSVETGRNKVLRNGENGPLELVWYYAYLSLAEYPTLWRIL
jgi:hypothetical protein